MFLKRMAVASLLALGVAGCHSQNFDPTRMYFRDQQVRVVPQNEAPQELLEWFRRDFPSGTITQIEQRQHASGETFYRVHYSTEPGAGRAMDYKID